MPRGPKGEKRLADGVSAIVYGSKSYFQSNQTRSGEDIRAAGAAAFSTDQF
jgi:hypothetical protein